MFEPGSGDTPAVPAAPAGDPAVATAEAPYRLRDATGPVLQYLDASAGLDPEARVARFRELVVGANPASPR